MMMTAGNQSEPRDIYVNRKSGALNLICILRIRLITMLYHLEIPISVALISNIA